MKKLVFAAALMLGTAAVAQEMTTDAATEADAAAEATTTVAPGNAAPERDARGIPVVSDPAAAPAGANQPVTAPAGAQVVVSPNQSAVFQPKPATGDYPVCSRTVTDGCVQAYERGRRPQ